MLTEKDYCDYDTCVALKKLGYKETTLAYYTSERFFHWERAYIYDVSIPDLAKSGNKKGYKHIVDAVSLWEAQKWMREEKNIVVLVHHIMTEQGDWEWELSYKYRSKSMYASYESALLEGIKEAVKILKEEK